MASARDRVGGASELRRGAREPVSATARSRLASVHAVLFASGISTMLVGLALRVPALLLISGPCLFLSGALIWLGSRISFAGPLGDALRMALGRRRVVTLHVRAVLWVLLGIVLTIAGVRGLRHAPGEAPPPPPRLAASLLG